MADEIVIVSNWVQSVATTATAITGQVGQRVYPDLAPLSASYPFVVHGVAAPTDVRVVGATRIMVDCEVTIEAIASTTSWTVLGPVADAIESTFHDTAGAVSGGRVISSQRIRPYIQIEEYEDDQIRHLGGVYRVLVQRS